MLGRAETEQKLDERFIRLVFAAIDEASARECVVNPRALPIINRQASGGDGVPDLLGAVMRRHGILIADVEAVLLQ